MQGTRSHVFITFVSTDTMGMCTGMPGVGQSPRDITGDFTGREQLIPAVYGTASLANHLPALPNEDSLNGILGTRSAHALPFVMHVLTCACELSWCISDHWWLLSSYRSHSTGEKQVLVRMQLRRRRACKHITVLDICLS